MNTNSNVYTIIYSTILVVVVAAVLAFAASALKPMQDENIKKETITQVLSAAAQADESVTISEDVVAMYAEMAVDAFYVDGNGVVGEHMNIGKENKADIKVESTSYLKAQNDIIKKIEAGQTELLSTLALPVYVIKVNSLTVNVIPCYGAGLWGPIWGYIAVAEDGRTLDGAIFDHKSETPGLGAKIAEKPFYSQFKGKKFGEGEKIFDVVKGGATELTQSAAQPSHHSPSARQSTPGQNTINHISIPLQHRQLLKLKKVQKLKKMQKLKMQP